MACHRVALWLVAYSAHHDNGLSLVWTYSQGRVPQAREYSPLSDLGVDAQLWPHVVLEWLDICISEVSPYEHALGTETTGDPAGVGLTLCKQTRGRDLGGG